MNTPGLISPLKPQDAISERAAGFLGKRRFWDWTEEDQAELDAWLAESILHEVAWLRLQGIVASTDRLAALDALERKQVVPGVGDKFRYRRFVLPLLAAASIASAAVWGGPFIVSLLQPPDRVDSTDVGGRTLLSFSDHTLIELNTDTTVRTRMTTAERIVWLEKGEAWFHVAHDAAHPFTVIVGKHRITDLGTEFLVRRGADDVDVTLLKGRASLSADGAQTATLTPGEEAVATSVSLLVTRKTPQELADELAWRRGILVFHDTRLADVVQEFNRYSAVKLVIADPSIADRRFNGEVEDNGLEDFLNFAQVAMKLRADRQGNSILLSRATPEKTKVSADTKRAP
jgi:transmembrane sensor